jgi:hypothetical protein
MKNFLNKPRESLCVIPVKTGHGGQRREIFFSKQLKGMDPLLQGDDGCSKRHLARDHGKVAREPKRHSREGGNPFFSHS